MEDKLLALLDLSLPLSISPFPHPPNTVFDYLIFILIELFSQLITVSFVYICFPYRFASLSIFPSPTPLQSFQSTNQSISKTPFYNQRCELLTFLDASVLQSILLDLGTTWVLQAQLPDLTFPLPAF